jgi:hypothetical protein
MAIKSFRGKLADGEQQTISLHTNNGSIGYMIKKFQIMMEQPGNTAQESLVQIFKIEQTTVPTSAATVDFSDNTLLAAAFQDTNVHPTEVVVFDNEIFNQDVYITYTDNGSGTNEDVNYYIELEQIKLALDENTVATLKDIRNIEAQNV